MPCLWTGTSNFHAPGITIPAPTGGRTISTRGRLLLPLVTSPVASNDSRLVTQTFPLGVDEAFGLRTEVSISNLGCTHPYKWAPDVCDVSHLRGSCERSSKYHLPFYFWTQLMVNISRVF
jgi:hypothetical protein